MRKFIAGMLVCVMALTTTGCATLTNANVQGIPEEVIMLGEAGGVALLFYTTRKEDFPDNKVRGLQSIAEADSYLSAMYGTGMLGQEPRYTFAGLLHDVVLDRILSPRVRRLAFVARIVVNKDGSLTGVPWADALLMANTLPFEDPVTIFDLEVMEADLSDE